MKKYLFNLSAIVALIVSGYLLFNAFTFEDNPSNYVVKFDGTPERRTCATMDVYNKMIQKYPEYKINREIIEKQTQEYIKVHGKLNSNTIITIPVVVHVVYNTPQQNISEDQVQSQIDVLNRDYRRHNLDTVNTPAPFKPVGADAQVQFCLARRDPNGNPTLGITRTQTSVVSWIDDDAVKFTSSGGHDAWDRNKYLNMWACNLGASLLGYAQFPGGPAATDGVVILYTAFGSVGILGPPYDKGRTATHEVGHWMNLYHIWGDDNGSCSGSDLVDDTPNQGSENYGCPGFPHTDNCSPNYPGVMYMNYMDYTDDGCMNIFTMGQSARITAALNGARAPILTSNGCTNVSGMPITGFLADSTSIIYGGTVHYADNSAGIPTSWNWTFTGGTPPTSSAQNPTVSYTIPGFYTVKLRISNSFGADSLTKTGYIKVRGANLSAFNLVSPPAFTRITTSANDPSTADFSWTKSVTAPLVTYKWKVKKLGTSFQYVYTSNSSGSDSVISVRKSLLDTLAQAMGTTGDSVRCLWQAFVYNGVDSMASSSSFFVTFVRGPIGIEQISSNVPSKFALYNSYPNPFNPSTAFKFDVAKLQDVKITIFDLLGREVAILVNGALQPGIYTATWNASNFASGVYYYKMESASFSEVKKMVLVK